MNGHAKVNPARLRTLWRRQAQQRPGGLTGWILQGERLGIHRHALLPPLASLILLGLVKPVAAQYGIYFDYHNPSGDSPKHLDHPHLDGVLLRWSWAQLEPQQGRYDFSAVERDITPWAKANKKVLIGVPLAGQQRGVTPDWVFDELPAIDFIRTGKNTRVKVPQYWHEKFLPTVSGLVRALGKTYARDPRIEGVMIGVGHIGFLTAAPNKGGAEAFLKAGWTPEAWKQYARDMIGLYREAFPGKPLILRGSELILRTPDPAAAGFPQSRPFFNDVQEEILTEAATKYGISVGGNGLNGDPAKFLATGIPSLFARLAAGASNGCYRLEVSDDWPLWVNARRRAKSSVDAKADTAYFQKCLENALGANPPLPRLPVSWIKMLETDLDCTNPHHPDFQPDCEKKLLWFKRQLLPPKGK